jgi:hypothetical protein
MMRRSRFWMSSIFSLTLVLLASSAFAAQNVGNTSQKGSLLIFPGIVAAGPFNTVVVIANAGPTNHKVHCLWMNEYKVAVNFDLWLTAKGSALIDARDGKAAGGGAAGQGFYEVTPFPAYNTANGNIFNGFSDGDEGSGYPSSYEGELVCFAVDNQARPIAYNHLKGEATIIQEDEFAFEYRAWAFQALGVTEGGLVGADPSTLLLTGATGYDACPSQLILDLNVPGSRVGYRRDPLIKYGETYVALSSCTQDIREGINHGPALVSAVTMNAWDANEGSHSGAYECIDSTWIFRLKDIYSDPSDTFDWGGIGTKTAIVKMVPTVADVCEQNGYVVVDPAPGIIGVKATEVCLDDEKSAGSEVEGSVVSVIGTNLTGQGLKTGSIVWSWDASGDPTVR